MAYNPGPPQGPPPYPQPAPYPQPGPQYPQPAPQYPHPAPQYPQPAPQYPQPGPQYPQPGPPYPAQPGPPPQQPVQPAPPYPEQQLSQPAPPQIDGYRDIGFDGGFVRPPAEPLPSGPPPNQPDLTLTQEPLSRDEVKDALAAFVAQHCCYGSGPIEHIQIRNVAPTFTFKYTLETFVEKRGTKWKFEPFSGSGLQTAAGRQPRPWEVPLTPKELFKDEKRVMEVPHTQSLKPCHDCQAHGDTRCKHCAGRGRDRCGHCGGSGQRMGDACARCGGVGNNKCTWCHGNGMVTCKTCKGRRNLKYYVELTVTWQVHRENYVVRSPGLPDSKVTAVTGETVCQAQGQFIWPFTGFPENSIATASERLVKKHQTGWPMARILQQRHDVQQIPIHSVSYHHDGSDGTFFVCGRENSVYWPDYPSQCCGCCLVM